MSESPVADQFQLPFDRSLVRELGQHCGNCSPTYRNRDILPHDRDPTPLSMPIATPTTVNSMTLFIVLNPTATEARLDFKLALMPKRRPIYNAISPLLR